jgi:transposase-like protein
MENNILNYKSKRGVHVPGDVKEYILKRVKEGSKTLKEIAAEHGISVSAISSWVKDEVGGISDSSFLKLQKENQLLKQLVAELSLKIRESEKRGW